MVVRTYQQASKSHYLTRLVVATDDLRIKQACEDAGAEVIMTDGDIPNGTERCAQALDRVAGEYDIVVNIQGDEPLIEPEAIDKVVEALQNDAKAVYSTPVTRLPHEEVKQRARVKCIMDQQGYAIYFSRGVLPFNKNGLVDPAHEYWLHLGLQCYTADFLRVYPTLQPTPCQLQEDLEQLKAIEHGYRIKVVKVDYAAHGVDEPDDVASIEVIMRNTGLDSGFNKKSVSSPVPPHDKLHRSGGTLT